MKAVIYTRVSTETQQVSGLGLDSQLATCQAHADRLGAEVVAVVTEAQSGRTVTKRPELQRALAMLAAGEAQVLIVAKLDRLSRSLRDLCDLLDLSARQGWSLVLGDLVDTTTPAGRVHAHVVGAFAEYERQIISQRTRDAMAQAKGRGVHCGRRSQQSPDVVARVVAERMNGATWQGIADGLNADGIPTARGARGWRVSTVQGVWQSSAGAQAYERALSVVARGIQAA